MLFQIFVLNFKRAFSMKMNANIAFVENISNTGKSRFKEHHFTCVRLSLSIDNGVLRSGMLLYLHLILK